MHFDYGKTICWILLANLLASFVRSWLIRSSHTQVLLDKGSKQRSQARLTENKCAKLCAKVLTNFPKWMSCTECHRFQQRFRSHWDGLNISNSGWILLNLYQMLKKDRNFTTLKYLSFSPKKVFLIDSSSYMFSRKIWILNNWQPNDLSKWFYLHREMILGEPGFLPNKPWACNFKQSF
jgi:hypothetical protein